FYYDDFYIGAEEVDETPPSVSSISVLTATQLEVEFSEPINQVSAETLPNYNVIGIGNPTAAVWDNVTQTSVTLSFPATFAENIESEIEFSGITDGSGNALVDITLPFTYVVSAVAESGDVVINEIFADPTPVIGLPEFEFVELFNASDEFFDLANWVFVNTTTEKTLPSFPLAPGEFVILCDESAVSEYEAFGEVIGISSFTALSNSGDSLTLKTPENLITDIVVYTDDWYNNPLLDDGGVSLERINPTGGCSGQNNWTASESFAGGSPGIINTVFDNTPDLTPPSLVFQQLVSLSILELTFDDQLDFNAPNEVAIDAGTLVVQNVVLSNNNSSLLITFT
ncbi:MAG: lamin tail domain-containing protein, partial [Flavobacteriales bacterium]